MTTLFSDIVLRFLGLTIAIIVLAGCVSLSSLRYAPNPVPAPIIPTGDLLLDAEAFPEGWVVFSCEPYCDRTERNGDSGRNFGMVDVPGHVTQQVMYFASDAAAKIKFQRYKEANLPDAVDPDSVQLPSTAFTPPPEIKYRSSIADDQYLGCGINVVPACRAGLRYGNYFTYFYFDLRTSYYFDYLEEEEAEKMLGHAGGLRLSQVETVLRLMDKHYAQIFDISLPSE